MTRSQGSMPQTMPKPLNEKELGTLYVYCEAPLMLHALLEKSAKAGTATTEKSVAAMHDVLAAQAPDDALLSLGLSGLVMSEHVQRLFESQDDLRALATELRLEAEQIVTYLGRLRIDLDAYRLTVSDQEIFTYLARVPDDLCVLSSIYEEMQQTLRLLDAGLSQAVRILQYQAESHADHARSYIEGHMKPGNVEKPRPLDHIPLPPELQPQHDPAKIIEFSLFRR